MREMKDSGVEWIGEIPSDWDVGKTLYALNMPITDGPHETPDLYDEGIPFVSAEAVSCGNGHIDFKHIRGYISQEFYDECCKKYIPQINDIYMIKSGATTGKVAKVETNDIFTIWSPLAVFRVDAEKYYHEFLYYFIQSDGYQKQIENKWTYGTQQNIGMRTLEKLIICFPPLKEQIKRANYLDAKCAKIDSIIEKQQAIIEKLKEYKLSIITEAVTKGLNPDVEMKDSGIEWIGRIPKHWNFGKVKNGTIKVGSGKTPKGGAEIYASSGILFLRSQNIYDDGLVLDEPTYITEEIDEEMANTRVYPGDVLLNITGGSIGRCCIFPIEAERANVNQHVSIIRVNRNVFLPEYMHYYWNSEKGKTAISSYRTGGNREGMSGEAIRNTPLPIPSLAEQKEITDYIEKINSKIICSIDKRNKTIEKLQEYKKSLIYEVVTGKKEV